MSALLDVRGLVAWYGAMRVLDGVDLSIRAGEALALVGRNGSGRSTLAKAVMGMVRVDGAVRVDGVDVAGARPFEIARRGIGYVAESRDVFPLLSVRDNLRLGWLGSSARGFGSIDHGSDPGARSGAHCGSSIGARIGSRFGLRFGVRFGVHFGRQAARDQEAQALEAVRARFPMLAERWLAKAGVLSGGEQQMLALARALLGRPRLLIVDEPAEGLAPRAVDALRDCLAQLAGDGVALLLIEQRMQLAPALAARVAVMGRGKIVYDGESAALDGAIANRWLSVG